MMFNLPFSNLQFSNKASQVFSSFLSSYNDIRHMKNIPDSLSKMSQCLLNEYNEKCINYYINNEIDRLLLQINEEEILERFYCSILPVMKEEYLISEFFNEVWKHGRFSRLSRLYSEKCISNGIFNVKFGMNLIEKVFQHYSCYKDCYNKNKDCYNRNNNNNNNGSNDSNNNNNYDSTHINNNNINSNNNCINNNSNNNNTYININNDESLIDSLIILLQMKDYSNLFKDLNLHSFLLKTVEDLFYALDEECIKILEFLIYFQDKEKNELNIKEEQLNIKEGNIDTAIFIFKVYKRIKSIEIRRVILENSIKTEWNKEDLLSNLLMEFIKVDFYAVFSILNEFQESEWEPVEIMGVIESYRNINYDDCCSDNINNIKDLCSDNNEDCNNSNDCCSDNINNSNNNIKIDINNIKDCSNNNNNIKDYSNKNNVKIDINNIKDYSNNNDVKIDMIFHHSLNLFLNDKNLFEIALKIKNTKFPLVKKSPSLHILKEKCIDFRILVLLFLINENVILNDLKGILKRTEKKHLLCRLIKEYLHIF